MEGFGQYKVVDELSRGPFGRVVRAKSDADPRKRFAIKIENTVVHEDFSDGFDDSSLAAEAPPQPSKDPLHRAFLEGAEVQRSAATFGSNWAAIHDVGECAEGVYYVTDFFRRSVRSLLTARTKVSASTLHQIACGVVSGLCDLRDACHRAHGNLKPSNILLDERSKLGRLRIKLTDPAGSATVLPTEADDIQSLGALLYQLVTQREFRPSAWIDVDSEEWSRLGRQGRQWGEFCIELLSPDPAVRPSLDQTRIRLARLKPQENLQRTILIAALSLFIGLITFGLVVHLFETLADHELSVVRTTWSDSLKPGDERLKAYRTMLPESVFSANEAENLKWCFEHPHSSLPNFTALLKKRQALDYVAKVQDHLNRIREKCIAQLTSDANRYKELEWTQPVKRIMKQIGASKPPAKIEELFRLCVLSSYLEDHKPGPDLDWDVLKGKIKDMRDTGDPDLVARAKQFHDSAEKTVRLEDTWKDGIEEYIGRANWEIDVKLRSKSALVGNEIAHPTTTPVQTTTKSVIADAGATNVVNPRPDRAEARAFVELQRKIITILPADTAWSTPQVEKIWHEKIESAWIEQRNRSLIELDNNPSSLAEISKRVLELPKTFLPMVEPLRQLDTVLSFNPTVPSPRLGGWRAELEQVIATERQKYLNTLVMDVPKFDPVNPEATKQFCEQRSVNYKLWCEQIARGRDAIVYVNNALDSAYLPDETPAGYGKPVRQWLADGRQSLNPAMSFLSPFIENAGARLKPVDDLSSVNSTARLVTVTTQSEPVVALAAWRQLGKLKDNWPATIQDLVGEMGIEDRIGKDLLPVRADLKTELEVERRSRWDNHLRLLGHASPEAVEATVAWAAGNLTRLPVPPNAIPAWFQFDLLLYKYKTDKNQQASESGFREAAKPLRTSPAVNSFLARYDDVPRVAAKITPENASVPLGKRLLNNTVRFTGLGGKINITFIRVNDKDGKVPPFYMSTTEVPIGLFGDVIAQGPFRRYANEVLKLLPPNAQQPQTWVGPHGWQIDQPNQAIVPRVDNWCEDFVFKSHQHLVPNRNHPMQCVTPEAALFMARLIGCRLPSEDEWKAAVTYSTQQALADPTDNGWVMQAWKLRDDEWAGECLEAARQGARRWLDDGIFLGTASPSPAIKIHADAISWNDTATDASHPSPAQQLKAVGGCTVSNVLPQMHTSNGRLKALVISNSVLFRDVNYNFNDSFHDLIGNVSEYVLDADSAGRCDAEVTPEDADKVAAFTQDPQTHVYVIGGSALSPPELGFDKPWPVTSDMAKNGFTDVGFRLAFSESIVTPPRHIDFAKAQYLTSDALPNAK